MNSLLFSYEDFNDTGIPTKSTSVNKHPRIKSDGYHDGVYSSLQRSIEDLQFLDVYDKLQNINSIEKMKMLHRIKVKCSDLKLENNNAWNSLESYCRSIEEDAATDSTVSDTDKVYNGSYGLYSARNLAEKRNMYNDKPLIAKFFIKLVQILINIVTGVVDFLRRFIILIVRVVDMIATKLKLLNKNSLVTYDEYVEKYGKEDYYYENLISGNDKTQILFKELPVIISVYVAAIYSYIEGLPKGITNELDKAAAKQMLEFRSELKNEREFEKQMRDDNTKVEDLLESGFGIKKLKGDPKKIFSKDLNLDGIKNSIMEISKSKLGLKSSMTNFENVLRRLKMFTRDKDKTSEKAEVLKQCKTFTQNVSKLYMEYSSMTRFLFRMITHKGGNSEKVVGTSHIGGMSPDIQEQLVAAHKKVDASLTNVDLVK